MKFKWTDLFGNAVNQAFALTARRWVLDATVTTGTIIALLGVVVPADNAMIITAFRARWHLRGEFQPDFNSLMRGNRT